MDPYIVTKIITSYVINNENSDEDNEEIKKIKNDIFNKHNNEKAFQ